MDRGAGSTASTGPRSGTAGSRSAGWSSCCRTSCFSHGGSGASWAGPAGIVATVGLVTLAVWAILPRWRSVVPRRRRRLIAFSSETAPASAWPRLLGDYESWRQVHRMTGLFLAVAFAHGLLRRHAVRRHATPALDLRRIGGVGIGFYLYRELLARRFGSLHDYQVERSSCGRRRADRDHAAPLGRPLTSRARAVRDGAPRGQGRLAPPPLHDRQRPARAGDAGHRQGAGRLHLPAATSSSSPGCPPSSAARTAGSATAGHRAAGLDRRRGRGHPVPSWLRSLDSVPRRAVDLFYVVSDEAPYDAELVRLTQLHPEVASTWSAARPRAASPRSES